MRGEVYPRQVAAGKLRQSVAAYHIERLRSVLQTLRWVEEHELTIKQRMHTGGSGELSNQEG